MQLRTVVMPPLDRDEPEEDWYTAKEEGLIPGQVWDLYRSTRYLSAAALAGFETADARVVTVYFSRLIRSVKDCLVDAAELRKQMHAQSALQYDPRKSYPQEFSRDAARLHRSAFRGLLVNLVGALDVFADVVAVLLPGQIANLRAGGAAFTDVEKWLGKPYVLPPGLITPSQHYAAELHAQLSPEVIVTDGPERDWLPLMRMYRNKSAHLGHQSFGQFGLQNKADEDFSFFIARSWPFVAEQYATTGLPTAPEDDLVDFSDVLNDWLMHQDLEEYSEGAYRKIRAILGIGFGVLHSAYVQLKELPVAQQTLADLEKNRQAYKFEYFKDAG